MRVCSYCGRENAETASHCAECGSPMAAVHPDPKPALEDLEQPAAPAAKPNLARKTLVVACGFAALCAAFIFSLTSSNGHRLKDSEAVRIADQSVQRAGFRLTDYAAPSVKLEGSGTNLFWRIIYEKNALSYSEAARPEAKQVPRALMVIVNDATRQTQLAYSRDAAGGGETATLPPAVKAASSATQDVDRAPKGN